MNEFTASNGYKVTPNGDGANVHQGIMSTPIYPDEMQALREFFQAEADERAGRWRYLDEPQYVVYYDQMQDRVTVFNENLMDDEDGGCGISRGNTLDYPSVQHIAQAYFAAHPEPKPWHDAKPGEVWSITGPSIDREAPKSGGGGAIALCFEDLTEPEPQLWFVYPDGGASDNIEVTDKVITAGYRIHPPQEQKA